MNSSDVASLVFNPEDLLALPIQDQGKVILRILTLSHGDNEVTGPTRAGRVNLNNFFNRANDSWSPSKFGSRQKDVDEGLLEAWNWLENHGFLAKDPSPGPNWFFVTKAGKEWLRTIEQEPKTFAGEVPKTSQLMNEVDALLKALPDETHSPDAARWWGRAKCVIEQWDASKYGEAETSASLFFSNLESLGKGASDRRRGRQQMIALLNQAKLDLERKARIITAAGFVPQTAKELSRKVFVVHGHDEGTREAVARFLEQLELSPIILHEQANRGRTVIEKVEAHGDVGFAVVLLTLDDEGCKKGGTPQPRARQNVLLELGYFVGRLGRNHVCALMRGELEIPSDFTGVIYETFDSSGAWKLALGREFKAAGLDVDLNKAMGRK